MAAELMYIAATQSIDPRSSVSFHHIIVLLGCNTLNWASEDFRVVKLSSRGSVAVPSLGFREVAASSPLEQVAWPNPEVHKTLPLDNPEEIRLGEWSILSAHPGDCTVEGLLISELFYPFRCTKLRRILHWRMNYLTFADR